MHIFCKRRTKLLLVLPAFLFFLAFTLYPLVEAFRLSLFSMRLAQSNSRFVGLENFIKLTRDAVFHKALLNTFIVLAVEMVLMMPFGLLLGLIIFRSFRGNVLVKVVTFIPYILSGVMVGLIWSFILDPNIGMLNGFLKAIGQKPVLWIGGLELTPYSVAVVDTWKNVGFFAVLFMAGMKMIPKDSFEAARIDGATGTQSFFYVTLPLLKEQIKICTVLVVINAINTFQTVVVLTGGGPNKRSNVLASLIYFTEFHYNYDRNFGYGSAMAVIMFVLIMSITIIFLNLTQKRVDE